MRKLGHHGSRTSSSAPFPDAVGAELAIASAPCLGRFGMLHREVRERVAAAGASVWWTGRDGALLVSLARPRWVHALAPAGEPGRHWRCGG